MPDSFFHIHVKDLKCFAYHGLYPMERTSGQDFRLDITVTYRELGEVEGMDQSVDYSRLVLIAREVMSETEELLETVAQKMASRIKEEYPRVLEINISIDKLAAAIPNFGGRVGITHQKKYD
jgi:dihydroneopterin aldolase